MVAHGTSTNSFSTTARKQWHKNRTVCKSNLLILTLSVLLAWLLIYWSCPRLPSDQVMAEMPDAVNKLTKLMEELQEMKHDYEYKMRVLQEWFRNGSCKQDSKRQQLNKILNDKEENLMGNRNQQARHLLHVRKHLTETEIQLQNLVGILTKMETVPLDRGRVSGPEVPGYIQKMLQQVGSFLNDVDTNLNNVTRNIILIRTNTEQQQKEEYIHTTSRMESVYAHDVCPHNIKGEIKNLQECFTNKLNDAHSKLQSENKETNQKLSHLEWQAALLCLVCCIFIMCIFNNGHNMASRLLSPVPSGLPLYMVTVVTFTAETYDHAQAVLPHMLGQAAPSPREVNYTLLTGELDLSQIPPSCGYIVVIGYDSRNSILEDMDGSMGSRKRQTIVELQNTKRDVIVIYIENDAQRREPPADSLYNTDLGRCKTHPILHQLVDNQHFMSLNNWTYTPHQAEHVREWVKDRHHKPLLYNQWGYYRTPYSLHVHISNTMERFSGLASDPAAVWSALQDRGQDIIDLVRTHPWTSLGVAAGTALVWSYIRAPRNLPPGPRGLPVVGALSCYSDDLPEKLLKWREQYGDVISFYRLGKLNIMLNSERSIRDAFAKQGDEFGHRAEEADMALLGLQDEIFAKPYDETWKKNKKFAVGTAKNFGFGTAKSEVRMQDQLQVFEEFLMKQNGDPTDVSQELKLVCAGAISSVVLGTSDSWQDPGPVKLTALTTTWEEAFINAFFGLVIWQTFVPQKIAHFMIRGLSNKLINITEELARFMVEKINHAAVDISEREPQNMIDAYLKERGTSEEVIKQIAYTVNTFLPDAVEGISSLKLWCLLRMVLDINVQHQIHKEISLTCGSDRVPSLSDKDKLPTIQALIHEVLRTMLALPLSAQRSLHQDVQFYGFTLPKGALVSANNYSVHHDPEIFPDPDKFLPSRFINQDGSFNSTLGSKFMAFSIGPRKCLGEAFVRQQIYLFLARLVQRFEMRPDPAVPNPTLEKTQTSLFPRPHIFKVCFIPR